MNKDTLDYIAMPSLCIILLLNSVDTFQLGNLLVASFISRKMSCLALHHFFAFTDQTVPPEGMWDVAEY